MVSPENSTKCLKNQHHFYTISSRKQQQKKKTLSNSFYTVWYQNQTKSVWKKKTMDKKKTQVEMLRCRGGRGWKLLLTKMRKNFFRLLASNGYPFTWRKYLFWHKYSWVLHTFLFECMYARIYILWSKNNDCWIT